MLWYLRITCFKQEKQSGNFLVSMLLEFVMFADASGKIQLLQTDSDNVEPVPIKFEPNATISRPVALAFDQDDDRVYWTDVTLKIICRAFRNGTGFEVLFDDGVGVADGLTVDRAGGNLYWTDTTYNTIEVSRLDGSFRERLFVNEELDEPRDIIVDPVGGYVAIKLELVLFWSKNGRSQRRIGERSLTNVG